MDFPYYSEAIREGREFSSVKVTRTLRDLNSVHVCSHLISFPNKCEPKGNP